MSSPWTAQRAALTRDYRGIWKELDVQTSVITSREDPRFAPIMAALERADQATAAKDWARLWVIRETILTTLNPPAPAPEPEPVTLAMF